MNERVFRNLLEVWFWVSYGWCIGEAVKLSRSGD